MAWELQGFSLGMLAAGADLSAAANQFKFVKLDANGNVVLCAAATDIPIGVLQNTPKSGDAADVMVVGVSKVSTGAVALAIGALIGTDANGQGVALVAGTDTTKYVCGRVLTASTVQGGLVSALIDCAAPHRAA